MIVVTRALDQLAKQAVGEGNVAVSGIKTMMDKFRLDPEVSQIAGSLSCSKCGCKK